jgi:hypothetical protein
MDSSGGGDPDFPNGAIAVIRQTLGDAQWQAARRQSCAFLRPRQLAPRSPLKTPWLFHSESELDLFRIQAIASEFRLDRLMILGSGTEYRRPGRHPRRCHAPPALNYPKSPDVGTLAKQEGTDLFAT